MARSWNLKIAFEKFKTDALSKGIYDIVKWLVIFCVGTVVLKLFPDNTVFGEIFNRHYTLSVYAIFLWMLVVVTLNTIVLNFSFNKKYSLLKKDNQTDSLTGLKNVKAMKEYLTQKIKESEDNGKPLSVILIDVDDFRDFNSNYSQDLGDRILAEVGQILSKDNRITDETFRQYSRGDEFVVVSTQTNMTEVRYAAERKRQYIADSTFLINNQQYKLTVCCGLAEFRNGDTFETLLGRANYAVRQIAKVTKGKNCTANTI